jgi:drug/metabolite transporter (DMT)-like permease
MSRPSTASILFAFAAIYIIWGTTFLGITLTLRSMPAFTSGALRFLLASGAMYVWLRTRERHPFAGLHRTGTALCGVLLTGMGNGFIIWAQLALPSGIAALFVGSLPVWILVLDWAFFSRQTPRVLGALGVAFGFAGIAVLSLHTQSLNGAIRPIHVMAVLIAELAWALGTLLQPRFTRPARVTQFTCLQMFIGALFQALMAVLDREWIGFHPTQISLVSWLALLYLVIFGSLVAFNCYAFLVAHVAPQKIATYALVNPVIALALGAVILGERITPAAALSTVLVLVGVALVLLQRGAQQSPGARRGVATGQPEELI